MTGSERSESKRHATQIGLGGSDHRVRYRARHPAGASSPPVRAVLHHQAVRDRAGLAVSYGIVQNHLGMIDVQSVAGQGATFTLTFPVLESVPGSA